MPAPTTAKQKQKQFLLIAGVDHVNFEIDCGALCRLRVRQLISEHKGSARLKFFIYDFQRGSVTTIIVPRFAPGTAEVTEKKFIPITVKDYPGFKKGEYNDLKKTIIGAMSITDVYAAIIAIGKNEPGELVEWSFMVVNALFFSYAIVNSFYDDKVHGSAKAFKKLPKGSRDPDDLDPRLYLDFSPPNMSKEERKTFLAAFDEKDAYVWFWGGEQFIPKGDKFDREVFKSAMRMKKPFATIEGLDDDQLGDERIITIPIRKSKEMKEFFSGWGGNLQSGILVTDDTVLITLGVLRYITCSVFFGYKGFAKRLPLKIYGLFRLFSADFSSNNSNLPEAPLLEIRSYENIRKILGLKYAPHGDYIEFPAGYQCIRPGVAPPPKKIEQPATQPVKPERPPFPSIPDSPIFKPTHPFFRLKEYERHYIFIAGVDFRNTGDDFMLACRNRIDFLLLNDQSRTPALFQLLNVASGTIIYCEVVYSDGTHTVNDGFEIFTPKRDIRRRFSEDDVFGFDRVKNDASNYETVTDVQGDTERCFKKEAGQEVMTMDFIYQRITAIGEKAPGRLLELSFFTHGDETGPKIVNERVSEQQRSSPDYRSIDPDAYRDFPGATFDEKFFRPAFTKGKSVCRCWGYLPDPDFQKLLKAILASKEYNAPGLTDATVLTLRNPTPRLRLFLQRAVKLIADDKIPPVKIQIPFGRLLHYFAAVLKSSYFFQLSVAAGINVYAGVPGMNAVQQPDGERLFFIPPAYELYAAFFKQHFGFKTDPEKCGYLGYVPDFPWESSVLAGVKIETEILESVEEFPVEAE